VHGYQGNSFDFQKSKNYLKKHNKNTTILVIESITQEMDKCIEDLGKKVADEVIKHVGNSIINYDRINFVGFSLGGVIVRACLGELGFLRNKLGIFVTFSSPHLGIS
jgi:esterase/lipase